jgi:membrane protein YqaA with SNARE-associated domain
LDQIARQLFALFIALGGFGLLGAGVLTSFIFVPFGHDLLMVALTARNTERMLFYAAMSAAGSVLGALLVDLVFRKGGESGLAKRLPPKRLDYIKRKVSTKGGPAIALAALVPPPFPYSPFIMAASALQYPRKKLLAIIGIFRLIRFMGLGLLAIYFGSRILRLAEHPVVQIGVLGLIVLAIAGSAISIYRWVKGSRKAERSA